MSIEATLLKERYPFKIRIGRDYESWFHYHSGAIERCRSEKVELLLLSPRIGSAAGPMHARNAERENAGLGQ